MPEVEVAVYARQYVTVEVEDENDAAAMAVLNIDDEAWEIDWCEIYGV